MSTIPDYDQFLRNLFDLLDNYLVKDLETLVKIAQQGEDGGVSYPALQTIMSGMELLGLILSGETNEPAFSYYWEESLCKQFSEYSGFDDIFRRVIRDGTAHFYLVKAGITVSTDGNDHLKYRNYKGSDCINIDLQVLYNHFIYTYNKIKSDLLSVSVTNAEIIKGCEKLQRQMIGSSSKVNNLIISKNLKGPIGVVQATSIDKGYSGPTDFIQPSGMENLTKSIEL